MKLENYDYPTGLQIELTGKCNLKCHHCYNSSGEAGVSDLSDKQWLNFIDSYFIYASLPQINFTGGECLMRKKLLLKMIEKISAKDANTKIGILTNGWYVEDNFLERLKVFPNTIYFQISIDGANKKEHEAVRRVYGSWEKAMDACLRITKAGFSLGLASVVTTKKSQDIKEIFDLALLLEVDRLGIGPAVPLGRAITDEQSLILGKGDVEASLTEINRLKQVYEQCFHVDISSPLNSDYYSSRLISKQNWMMIDNMGNLKLDSRLPFLIGNILESDLLELWEKVWQGFSNSELGASLETAIMSDLLISNLKKVNL